MNIIVNASTSFKYNVWKNELSLLCIQTPTTHRKKVQKTNKNHNIVNTSLFILIFDMAGVA